MPIVGPATDSSAPHAVVQAASATTNRSLPRRRKAVLFSDVRVVPVRLFLPAIVYSIANARPRSPRRRVSQVVRTNATGIASGTRDDAHNFITARNASRNASCNATWACASRGSALDSHIAQPSNREDRRVIDALDPMPPPGWSGHAMACWPAATSPRMARI